jgi:alpha-L-fucosidase
VLIKRFGDGRDWFFEKHFGLFVHWGLYAIPAWHEQIQWRKDIDRKEYEKLIHEFNPTKFDPEQWLDLAEEAGMKYITFTAKHHDGFCLWDTKYTDFNVMNSPFEKDILKMITDACRKRNFPLCIYYSVADWHHPNFPHRGKSHEFPVPFPGDEPNENKYVEYVKKQMEELCTKYGPIHGVWWDVNNLIFRNLEINEMIHTLQPKAVINNRGFDDGDYVISERDYNAAESANIRSYTTPTEACQSVGMESWGYRKNDHYYTALYLKQSIDHKMAMGANYLLNIGPKADGSIDKEQDRILLNIGKWFKKVEEAFINTVPCSELTDNENVFLTRQDNVFYVHLCMNNISSTVVLNPIDIMPRKVTLLNTMEPLESNLVDLPRFFKSNKKTLCIHNLPIDEMRDTVMVIKLEFDDFNFDDLDKNEFNG